MVSQKIIVKNEQGLHMRPAGAFVKLASKYKCNIMVAANGKEINGKSVMNLIGACIKCGTEMEIKCDGDNEQEALNTLIDFVEAGMGE